MAKQKDKKKPLQKEKFNFNTSFDEIIGLSVSGIGAIPKDKKEQPKKPSSPKK